MGYIDREDWKKRDHDKRYWEGPDFDCRECFDKDDKWDHHKKCFHHFDKKDCFISCPFKIEVKLVPCRSGKYYDEDDRAL